MSFQYARKKRNGLPPALLSVLVIPLALLGGGEVLAPAHRGGPGRACRSVGFGQITSAQAMGVYPGEAMRDVLRRLGAPAVTSFTHPGGCDYSVYDTTNGGTLELEAQRGRVLMVHVTDRDRASVRRLCASETTPTAGPPRDRRRASLFLRGASR